MRISIWPLALALFTVSCAKAPRQERLLAPTGPTDIGWAASHLSEAQVQKILSEFPKAQVRRVYPKAGMYEFFGVDGPAVEAQSGIKLLRNHYRSVLPRAVPGPEGVEVGQLHRCKVAEKFPESHLTVNGKTLTADATLTLELGRPMQISTQGSRAHAEFPGTLASAIVVVPSKLSRLGQQTFSASEISYLPDAVGAYRIYGVVQDGRDVCATEAANLIITTNPAFAPTGSEPKVNTQFMRHLRELDAQNVWALSEGQGQFIAIVDSGVNYNHPLLAPNMEINLAETANGEDEDGNGLKDDILGYDFVNSDPFPFDDDGHGSHVAGLASGRQFGLARKAHILAIKSMTAMGGDAASVAAGIHYAVDRGARILNLSLGMNDPHPLLIEAVAYAEDHGALLIVAAGNGDFHSGLGFDIDQIPLYPACLPNENILAVAASDHINALAPYSNFGKQNVDIVAPGGVGEIALVSTATLNPSGDLYSTMSGTSMAAPLVAAAAADLLAKAPTLKPHEVVQKIMDTGRLDAALNKVTRSGRRLDARALLSNVSF